MNVVASCIIRKQISLDIRLLTTVIFGVWGHQNYPKFVNYVG
jgi:hypothetical protein